MCAKSVQHYVAPDSSGCPRELDWTVQFIADPSVSFLENALLVAVAYPCEFLVHGLGILVVGLMLRHNLFYLSHIYQRHRAKRHPAREQVVLDFDDPERCFGLREMHSAFNFQILVLIAGGLLMMTSRIVNVDATPIGLYYERLLSRLMPGVIAAPETPPATGRTARTVSGHRAGHGRERVDDYLRGRGTAVGGEVSPAHLQTRPPGRPS